MSNPIDIKRKINMIEDIISYFNNVFLDLDNQCKSLLSGVEEYYSKLSLDEEYKNLLEEEIREINKKFSNKCDRLKENNKLKEEQILKEIQTLEQGLDSDILKELKILNDLIKNKSNIINKVIDIVGEPTIKPVIGKEDLEEYSLIDIKEFLEQGIEFESQLESIDLENLKLSFFKKDFWYPAGKLKISNRNVKDALKALNIVGVLLVLTFLSNFVVAGLFAFTVYIIFKNQRKQKPLEEIIDYLYTIYDLEDNLRERIKCLVSESPTRKIDQLKKELNGLRSKLEGELNDLEKRKREELENTRIRSEKDKEERLNRLNLKLKEDLEEAKQEINVIKELFKDFNDFQNKLRRIQKDLIDRFEEENKAELTSIVNHNTLLSLDDIHLGLHTEEEDVNFKVTLPFGSYLFIHREDKTPLRTLMKYIACQLEARLRGNLIQINILDPQEYGTGLSEIVYNDMSVGCYYTSAEVDDFINQSLERFTRDIKKIFVGYDDIRKFNEDKVQKGSTPYKYTVNLIQNYAVFDNPEKIRQLTQTKLNGIINLVLISENIINEVRNNLKDDVQKEKFFEFWDNFEVVFAMTDNCTVKTNYDFSINSSIEEEENDDNISTFLMNFQTKLMNRMMNFEELANKYNLEFEGFKLYNIERKINSQIQLNEFIPIEISSDTFRKWGKDISKNKEEAKMNYFYFKDFVEQVVPPGTEFSTQPTNGIYLYPGYQDGDVEKPVSLPMTRDYPHYFKGGRSGMGKSNAINVELGVLIRKYSPEDLNIYYLDFKSVEGAKYKRNPTPHFKCISTTQDPYYLMSLLDYIEKELRYRQDVLLPKYNAGQLKDLRKQGIKVADIIVLIDEVGEIFKISDELTQEFKTKVDTVARLGSASGCHLYFTSQDVSEKFDAGIMGQFRGRMCLPVNDPQVSKIILGNTSGADSDYQKVGDMTVNTEAGDERFNIRLRVPLIEPEDMEENFRYVNELCGDKYPRECILFDENEVKGLDILRQELKLNKADLFSLSDRDIIIGENAQFALEDAPVGIKIAPSDSQNFIVISQSRKRRIELLNTVVANFAEIYGEKTVLYVLRGNKDYSVLDITESYKGCFRNITEISSINDIIEVIEKSPIKNSEEILIEEGIGFEKSEVFEQIVNVYPQFADDWENFRASVKDLGNPLSKSQITFILEKLRNYIPLVLLVVEGIEEVAGIGVDYYSADDYKELIKYAPYYNVWNIWTTSSTPKGFAKFDAYFRHRLLGTLDTMDLSEYKFMKQTPDAYGGYMNIISPNKAFKFKRYVIEGLVDDTAVDNKVLIKNRINK